MRKNVLTLFALQALLSACGSGGGDTPPPAPACTGLTGQAIGGAVIDAAVVVPAAGAFNAYCKVNATVPDGDATQQLKFELHMPDGWDKKQMVVFGGGGFDGQIPGLADALAPNVVSVASNGGHTSTAADPGTDASFALDAQARIDFGYASAHTTLLAAKQIVQRHYGSGAQRHYFRGCSNGGREALMQATRYPFDYDGILAIAPPVSFSDLTYAFTRNARAFNAAGAAIGQAKAETISKAVIAACDMNDGVADNLVSKPLACNFNPASLRCPAGTDDDTCLTDAQVAAAAAFYGETRDGSNNLVYPGWEPGGENVGWPDWVSPAPTTAQYKFGNSFARYWLTRDAPGFAGILDPGFAVANYPIQLAEAKSTLDVTPDLSAFFGAHRKLILAHGMHDAAVSYRASVNYYNAVGSRVGNTVRDDNMEFFLLPGMQHCSGGIGPDFIDLFEATSRWVEAGERPSSRGLNVFKIDNVGTPLYSRPLCKYPTYPRYIGGSLLWHTSFTCS